MRAWATAAGTPCLLQACCGGSPERVKGQLAKLSINDPIANHAKFAIGHFFKPFEGGMTFVSMVSSHVDRGWRNLAGAMIPLMRQIGISAFQTALLPSFGPDEVKELNQLALVELSKRRLPIGWEIERAIKVSTPIYTIRNADIHFAGDPFEAMFNIHQWNQEIRNPRYRTLWGKRIVKYSVFNPYSVNSAPAKFCAYQLYLETQFFWRTSPVGTTA
jgi:hypothetical protein